MTHTLIYYLCMARDHHDTLHRDPRKRDGPICRTDRDMQYDVVRRCTSLKTHTRYDTVNNRYYTDY